MSPHDIGRALAGDPEVTGDRLAMSVIGSVLWLLTPTNRQAEPEPRKPERAEADREAAAMLGIDVGDVIDTTAL